MAEDNGNIELNYVKNFISIWNDKGSGAHRNGSFWRPTVQDGWFFLGDYARNDYEGADNRGVMIVVRAKDTEPSSNDGDADKPALAPPTGFTLIWNDKGSGADKDGSMWRPIPPDGYAALGIICISGYDEPSIEKTPGLATLRCVRKDLVTPASIGDLIWSDQGSGAKQDFSAWKPTSPSPQNGFLYVTPGTFLGSQKYEKPTENINAYALLYKLPISSVDTLVPPAYNAVGTLPETSYVLAEIQTLPWFAVKDPNLTPIEQITESPEYYFQRNDKYTLLGEQENLTSVDQSVSFSCESGTSKTESQSFSATTGIEFQSTFGEEGVFSVSITLSQSFTYTSGIDNTWSTSQVVTVNNTVPPNTKVAAFTISSQYFLYRKSGEQIANEVPYTPPDAVAWTAYDLIKKISVARD